MSMNQKIDKRLTELTHIEPSKLVFLCGAGISLDTPTLLPTVNTFICSVLKECNVETEVVNKVCQQFGYTNYRFEALIDEIRKKSDEKLMLAKLFDSPTFNKIHHFLTIMLNHGSSVITTNFDNCIENCSIHEAASYIEERRIVYKGKDLESSDLALEGVLVKIHGSQPMSSKETSELVITIKALAKTARAFSSFPNWRQYLLNLISDKIIVVMGYSCSDDFDVVPLLAESRPESVIWLNFNSKEKWPILNAKIENSKIVELQNKLPLVCFDGSLLPFLSYWSKNMGASLHFGPIVQPFSISQYVALNCPKDEDKIVLSNEILLSYGLYNETRFVENNINAMLQNVKARFRLKEYTYVIKICEKIIKTDMSQKFLLEIMYYLASAYYYVEQYEDALDTAKKCILIGEEVGDDFYCLNALINDASILYVYASKFPQNEQDPFLKKVEQTYHNVLEKAIGINLEAEANALWGLGDLARYKGNLDEARKLLNQSLELLLKIGNVYAINQLKSIIDEINNEIM